MICPIVCMMNVMKLFIPQLGMLSAIASKEMNNYHVYHLSLTICLWMKFCTLLQLCVHHVPQFLPKTTNKLGILITYNGSRKTKMNPYILKENISGLFMCNFFLTWHQKTYFVEPIYHNIQVIMTFP